MVNLNSLCNFQLYVRNKKANSGYQKLQKRLLG